MSSRISKFYLKVISIKYIILREQSIYSLIIENPHANEGYLGYLIVPKINNKIYSSAPNSIHEPLLSNSRNRR